MKKLEQTVEKNGVELDCSSQKWGEVRWEKVQLHVCLSRCK
jgi:hypothetical protein